MPAPTLITQLSQTAGSNGPTGSVDTPSSLDDYQRAHASFIATLRDGKGLTGVVSVASATTTSIGAENSMFLEITGTTTITSFGTTYNGPRYLRFAGALTLTHSPSLNLPGATNITTAAGDTCIALPNLAGNGWNVLAYQSATSAAARARIGAAAAGTNGDITDTSAMTAINGGQIGGFRNKLINGAFDLWERGVSFASPVAYTADRWYANTTAVTVGRGTGIASLPGMYVMTVTPSSATNSLYLFQYLEQQMARSLYGKTVTFSIVAYCASGTQSAVLFLEKSATPNVKTGFSTLASQAISITTTPQVFKVTATVPSDGSAAGLAARIYTTNTANGVAISFATAQLVPGSVATEFEHRDPGIEIALCQRYRETGMSYYEGYMSAGGPVGARTSFKVTKRVAPVDGVTLTFPVFTSLQNASVGATRAAYVDGFERYAIASSLGVVTARESWIADVEI